MKKILPFIAIFLAWRLGMFLIGVVAEDFFTYEPSFPYANTTLVDSGLPKWIYSWGNFDGVHYIRLIKNSYSGDMYIQAFFPFYPYLAEIPNLLIDNIFISQFLVSNLSFLVLIMVLYKFVESHYSKSLAKIATAILMLFPTAFYFGAVYTESLFLILVLLSFWFTEKKQYFIAAFFVAMATATRVVGLFLIPALYIEAIFGNYDFTKLIDALIHWQKNKLRQHWGRIKKILCKPGKYLEPLMIITLGLFGLVAYMGFLFYKFGDPLLFFHVQAEFGGIREESIVLYPQVVYRYIKILLTVRPFGHNYIYHLREFVYATVGLVLILYSAKKVKLSYVVFALLAFILPTLTGTFSSLPRYILVCFPVFIVISLWAEKYRWFKYIWFTSSTFLLVFNTMLFIQGYWIA